VKIESMPTFIMEMAKENQKTAQGSLFDKMLDTVMNMNENQVKANTKMQDVIMGRSDDSHGALIALEKSELQMQLAVTTRDKLIQGYQQIINMQI